MKNMRIPFLVGTGVGLWLATALFGQAPPAAPAHTLSFEVASIKPAPPIEPQKIMAGKLHIGMSVDKARVDIGNLSLADLIRTAYKIKAYQLTGPDWMASERFDVLAKMPDGANKDQVPEMLQALLADRFKLTVHRDSKEHSVFALVVGKNGIKMKEVEPDATTPAAPAADGGEPAKPGGIVVGAGENQMKINPNSDGKGATIAGGPFGQMKVSMGEAGMMRMEFAKLSMAELSEMLSRFTDRPVIDMTELKGRYQVTLDLSMEEMRNVARAAAMQMGIAPPVGHGGGPEMPKSPADAASTPSGNSVLGAVQQLGLRLDSRKLPVDIVVVDHVEKAPTEN
jgi:uncharacterized protein (TIGR03435 family)